MARQMDRAAVEELRRRADDGPVVMLNLLRFVAGGRERYREYEAAVAPLLERVGGELLYRGVPGPPLLGEYGWDLVLLVRYPSRGAFLAMVGSEEYREIEHLRSESLSEGELHPMDTV